MSTAPAPTWLTVDVDGAVVRVLTAGEGDPLLFLHGWGLSPRAYADGITRLTAAGVRVIAPALPGFGGSAGPALRSVDLPTYARTVAGVLDALDVDRPVFAAGHSFGGGVALQLAVDRPDRVRSLTLVNSVGGAPGNGGLIEGSWLRWAAGAVGELDPRHVLRSVPAVLRDFIPNLLRRPLTLALTARLALTASLADEAAALVEQGLPVLFVWADEDHLVGRGQLAHVLGSLPAEVVRGRHGWLLAHPEEFASLLHDALVVHAMLERTRRGHSVVLPRGVTLADLIPVERRSAARIPQQRRPLGA